jgi:hypothetical protein
MHGNTTAISNGSATASNGFIRGCPGYNARKRGSSQIAASTSVTVAHGLSATPNDYDIRLTAVATMGSASRLWMSNVIATDFRINVDAAPGVNIFIGWEAQIPLNRR